MIMPNIFLYKWACPVPLEFLIHAERETAFLQSMYQRQKQNFSIFNFDIISIVQSLPLESAFYTVILDISTHKNWFPKVKTSKLYFKDAPTHTWPTDFEKLKIHHPKAE